MTSIKKKRTDSQPQSGLNNPQACNATQAVYRSSTSILEWDDATSQIQVFRPGQESHHNYYLQLYVSQEAYYHGQIDQAVKGVEPLLKIGIPAIEISALSMVVASSLITGDAETCYQSLKELKKRCEKGLKSKDDPELYNASLFFGLRAETITMLKVVDLPEQVGGIDGMPTGQKAFVGYMLALRALRTGHYERALGIADAFQAIIGPHYPISKVLLHLVSCSATITLGDIDRAVSEFEKAWTIGRKHNLVTPFVELNYLLYGMPRRYFEDRNFDEYKQIQGLVRSYHNGWYNLRDRCGISSYGDMLTPLESYTVALVSLGWRNKEIAGHLHISENTVKHQLTSIYQKLGVSNRTGIRGLVDEMIGHFPVFSA